MLIATAVLISGNVGATYYQKVVELNGTMYYCQTDEQTEITDATSLKVYANAPLAFYAALKDLYPNSTPNTIVLYADLAFAQEDAQAIMDTKKAVIVIDKYQNVTLNLKGHSIYTTFDLPQGSQLIYNEGTFIVMDDSDGQNGIISSNASKPSPQGSDPTDYPKFANNTITNKGTVIVKSGIIENTTSDPDQRGLACYAIDNYANGEILIEGGTVRQPAAVAIRMYQQAGDDKVQRLTINGGTIQSYHYPFSLQFGSNATTYVNINGGTLISDVKSEIMVWRGGSVTSNTYDINITDGDFYCGLCPDYGSEQSKISIYGGDFWYGGFLNSNTYIWCPNTQIYGGTFHDFSTGYTSIIYATAYGYIHNKFAKTAQDFKDMYSKFELTKVGDSWTQSGHDGYMQIYVPAEGLEEAEDAIEFLQNSTDVVSGNYVWGSGFENYWVIVDPSSKEAHSAYEDFKADEHNYIAEGYAAIDITGVDETDGNDLKIVPTTTKETNNDGSWATPETWLPLDAPDAATDVTVKNEIVVESGIAEAHGVEINGEGQIVVKKGAVLEIGAGGIKTSNHNLQPIIVEAGGTLRVGVGGVSKEAGTLNPVEIYNDGTNSGAFMINPNAQINTMPEATITLTTNVRKGYWQHLALPIENLTEHSNDKSAANAVYEWKDNDWNQLGGWDEIEAFKGYDFTNNYEGQGKVTYTFKGNLAAGNENAPLLFDHAGTTFFGNSYTAPISLEALFKQIGSDMANNTIEKTAYVYNSTKRNYEWTNQLGLEWSDHIEVAFKTIAPMQGFWMNLQSGETAGTTINYRNAVWNNSEELGNPQKAPSRKSSCNNSFSTVATINVTAANGAADKVMLVESEDFSSEFENGSDASKMMSEESFNLFATTENGNQSMVATDNLEGTILSFQAADAINYTLNFSHIHGNEYAIRDLKTGAIIPMVENGTYNFVAQPNSVEDRFAVVATYGVSTNNQQVVAAPTVKGIYSISGQYMGKSTNWDKMPAGVYIVDGIRIAK